MDERALSLLIDPATHKPLRRETTDGKEVLIGPGTRYPVRQGIPVFVKQSELTGLNKKYRRLYDRLAPLYDFPYAIYDLATRGGTKRARLQYLEALEIEPGENVLEVAIGTGANLRHLRPDAAYYGLDISWGMLRKCRRNLERWDRQAQLFLGDAERLPFCDDAFDVVFHLGGMNFFNDKAAAIQEMVRVAKPGTKILIVDETDRHARRNGPLMPPISLVPGAMEQVRYEDSRGGRLYELTFRKPR